MRNILLIILTLSLFSCTRTTTVQVPVHDTVVVAGLHDTSYVHTIDYDTIYVSSGRTGCDSLRRRLNTANLQLNRVRYYTAICNRNRSQSKFLLGWINRAIR